MSWNRQTARLSDTLVHHFVEKCDEHEKMNFFRKQFFQVFTFFHVHDVRTNEVFHFIQRKKKAFFFIG